MRSSPVLGLVLAVLALGAAPASAKVLITVDKSAQVMNVSVDGVHRWTWPVSTGVPRYDTPSGSHRAFRMEADHFSKEWDDAPMPHSIFFTPKGHAIHGYLNTRNIGSPASHGCVRLAPANAKQLFELVQRQGVLNTTVVLTGDVRVAMARKATQTASRNAGADPRLEARLGPPTEIAPAAGERLDGAAPRGSYGHDQSFYGSRQPQYDTRPRAEYGRTYDTCPPPPPGFPAPSCYNARAAAQARIEPYPPRRYDYGQPQYEPDPPRHEQRRGFPFGF